MAKLKTINLISSPQTLTDSWTDLGSEMALNGEECLKLWVDLDVNDSTGIQFRVLGRLVSEGTEYESSILTDTTSKRNVEPEIYEIINNVDQKCAIKMDEPCNIPFIQFQVKVTVVGAIAGKILTSDCTLI